MKRRVFLAVVALTSIGTAWHLLAQSAGESLVDGFKTVEVASVSDAIEQLYGQRSYMSHEMRPLAVTKFAGTAVTVQLKREEHKEGSAASQGMLDAIDAAPPGSVYVMVLDRGTGAPGSSDAGQGAAAGQWSNAGIDYAGIGGLMATAMKYRGFAGAVIDASVRDTPQIRKLQFPVFSRGVAPSTTINHFRVTGVNVPVTCAGVQVNPGDIITADEDGVAVVPKDRAAEILKKSQELDDTEHRMIPFIEKFKSIREAVKQFGRI
jgi:regulator of RNase E activity RraA